MPDLGHLSYTVNAVDLVRRETFIEVEIKTTAVRRMQLRLALAVLIMRLAAQVAGGLRVSVKRVHG